MVSCHRRYCGRGHAWPYCVRMASVEGGRGGGGYSIVFERGDSQAVPDQPTAIRGQVPGNVCTPV